MGRINKLKKQIYSFKRKISYKGITYSISSISPLVYYWDFEPNWGDSINEFVFSSVLGETVISSNSIFNFNNREIITGIGSVLNGSLNNYSIWGSGFLSNNHSLINKPNKLLAIRGKYSLKKVHDLFGMNTDVLGDPGLLFKEYYNPNLMKKYDIGIIPHFKELNHNTVLNIKEYYGSDINIISPRLDIFEFANQVGSCERILSSSLHGLVLAESYGIATSRIHITNKIIGGDYKFNDYYSGVNVSYNNLKCYDLSELWEAKKIFSTTCEIKDLSYSKEDLTLSLKNSIIKS